jgi:hypothetical protein
VGAGFEVRTSGEKALSVRYSRKKMAAKPKDKVNTDQVIEIEVGDFNNVG